MGLGTFKVIGNDAIRWIVYDFLMFSSNYGSILHRLHRFDIIATMKSGSGVTLVIKTATIR